MSRLSNFKERFGKFLRDPTAWVAKPDCRKKKMMIFVPRGALTDGFFYCKKVGSEYQMVMWDPDD